MPCNFCSLAKITKNSGQTVLPLVLLMGGLIVLSAITMAFLSRSFLASSYGFQISEKAKAVAASGAYDALIRLTRNKDLSGAYSLPLGTYSADVSITQDSPVPGQAAITSVSAISGRQRKVSVVVSRSPSTGQIILTYWKYIE
ncbi:MAG: hypothetical protein AAB602_02115 [Patescibacteria group bacterium]